VRGGRRKIHEKKGLKSKKLKKKEPWVMRGFVAEARFTASFI
jgi:hypothetical protein